MRFPSGIALTADEHCPLLAGFSCSAMAVKDTLEPTYNQEQMQR
jgi:hypothetical protein